MSCGVTGVAAGGAAAACPSSTANTPATMVARVVNAFVMISSLNRRRGDKPPSPGRLLASSITNPNKNPSFALAKPGLSAVHRSARLVADRNAAPAQTVGRLDEALDDVAVRR